MVIGTASTDKPASVAEKGGLCFRAVLTSDLIALDFFQDVIDSDQSVDEEHSGEGARVIAYHSDNTATLGTLHLLVPLLLQ